jgi:endonuclease III related protein
MIEERRRLLEAIFTQLFQAFGPQHWWPAKSPFEVIVGAILTQNTAWKNVTVSIRALEARQLLTLEAIGALPVAELAAIIRSSGYYNQKAGKLKAFCNHLESHWQNDLNRFLKQQTAQLRQELLSLPGIGPETADSIILYAAAQPSFVVDSYTRRIFERHGRVHQGIHYDELRAFFMCALPADVKMYQEYHALLVRTGHLFCRRNPSCLGCPLESWPRNLDINERRTRSSLD